MRKRAFDVAGALGGLLLVTPLLVAVALAIWLYDRRSPFYIAPRMARGGGTFRMVKFRSMVVNGDSSGVHSTGEADKRITPVGRFVRSYKLDELVQLWNVLKGDMSLVGPRPQVKADADRYTVEEKRLLTVRPGITDLASIVFSDEGAILGSDPNPDERYDRLIRPWKSRLALLCVDRPGTWLDLRLILLTAAALFWRKAALRGAAGLAGELGAGELVKRMAARREPLVPYAPPGSLQPEPPRFPPTDGLAA